MIVLLLVVFSLSGCISVKQHEKVLSVYEIKIEQLKREKKKLLEEKEAIKSTGILLRKQDKEELKRVNITLDEYMELNEKSLSENMALLNDISRKEEVIKEKERIISLLNKGKKVVKEETNSCEKFSLEGTYQKDGFLVKKKLCDDNDVGCYGIALLGKNPFRKILLDKIYKEYGFLDSNQIEKFRREVLKRFKNKVWSICSKINLSEGKSILYSNTFEVFYNDVWFKNSTAFSFRSNSMEIKNKKLFNVLQNYNKEEVFICAEFDIRNIRKTYSSLNMKKRYSITYARVHKLSLFSAENNRSIYRFSNKVIRKIFPKTKFYPINGFNHSYKYNSVFVGEQLGLFISQL